MIAVRDTAGWLLVVAVIAAHSWLLGVSFQRDRERPSARYPSVCRPVDWHDGRPSGTACAYFERLGDALDYATETGDVVLVPPRYYQ